MKYCTEHVSLFIASIHRAHFQESHCWSPPISLCMLPMAVARSMSGTFSFVDDGMIAHNGQEQAMWKGIYSKPLTRLQNTTLQDILRMIQRGAGGASPDWGRACCLWLPCLTLLRPQQENGVFWWVCLSFCLSVIISSELYIQSSPNFFWMLHMDIHMTYIWPWLSPPLAA